MTFGYEVWGEAFIDRGYLADGRLVPRTEAGAVVHEPSAAVDRALELAETGGGPVELEQFPVIGRNPNKV